MASLVYFIIVILMGILIFFLKITADNVIFALLSDGFQVAYVFVVEYEASNHCTIILS